MTKEERLLEALGDVGDDLIQQAAEKPKRLPWRSVLAAAACLVLVIGAVRVLPFLGMGGSAGSGSDSAYAAEQNTTGKTNDDKEFDAGEAVGSVAYDVYTGPVMPMTLTEPAEGLTAKRSVTYDFASYTEADPDVYRIHTDVTDAYTLYNSTDTDMTVTAVYPFMAKLSDFDVLVPRITVDGAETEGEMSIGGALYGDGDVSSGVELMELLSDGSYFEAVFEEAPALTHPVTVYSVTGLTYDGPVGGSPTLAMEFTAAPSGSRVLISGGTALRYDDESGGVQLRMNVQEFIYGDDIHVIILGEDIDGYTLQGYSDHACREGSEVEGFRAEIERTEMTLREFLAQCIDWDDWGTMYNDGLKRCIGAKLTARALLDETARTMEQAGALEIGAYLNSLILEDYISSTLYAERMLYLSFPVTVPAGGAVTVTADMVKYSHVLEYGRGEDLHGYDLMTHLGSVLEITEQTVSAVNTENVELVDGNIAFDETVTMDETVECYWMHVRKK